MPLMARVFHRTRDIHADCPITSLPSFIGTIRTDGYLLAEGIFMPYEDIALIVTYEAEAATAPVFSLVPKPDKPL